MCPKSEELSAYHDGALDAERSRQMELHARTCTACAGELAMLRRLSDWLTRQRPEPSPAAVRRVVQYADGLAERNEAPTMGALRRVGRILSGLAASVLVFGVISLAQQPTPQKGGTKGLAVMTAGDWEDVMLRGSAGESGTPEQAEFAEWVVSGLSGASPSSGASQR
jgi:anti-sigma factor RsiW